MSNNGPEIVAHQKRLLKEKLDKLNTLNEDIEGTEKSFNFLKNNRNHLKTQSEVVDLREWKAIEEQLSQVKDVLDVLKADKALLVSHIAATNKFIEAAEKQIAESAPAAPEAPKLAKIIQFPKRP